MSLLDGMGLAGSALGQAMGSSLGNYYRPTIYGQEVSIREAQQWLKQEGLSGVFDWSVWSRNITGVNATKLGVPAPPRVKRTQCSSCGAPWEPKCSYCGSR